MPEQWSFGMQLRTLRTARGLSLADLAQLVHYSKGHLSRVETGAKPPSDKLAESCDDVLNAGGQLRSDE